MRFARNAIPAKNIRLQHELIAKATIDPSFNDIIDGFTGTRSERAQSLATADPGRHHRDQSPTMIQWRFTRRWQRYCRNPLAPHRTSEKARIAAGCRRDLRWRVQGHTKERGNQRTRLLNSRSNIVQEAIMAADVTDANLGTIAGTLVTLRTLNS